MQHLATDGHTGDACKPVVDQHQRYIVPQPGRYPRRLEEGLEIRVGPTGARAAQPVGAELYARGCRTIGGIGESPGERAQRRGQLDRAAPDSERPGRRHGRQGGQRVERITVAPDLAAGPVDQRLAVRGGWQYLGDDPAQAIVVRRPEALFDQPSA
jgi:hypothetical protein